MPSVIYDTEFGDIAIKRIKNAKRVTLRVDSNGVVRISMPFVTPLFVAKRLLQSSRNDIRSMLETQPTQPLYDHDQPIGKSHHLLIQQSTSNSVAISLSGQHIIARINDLSKIRSPSTQEKLRDKIKIALRKEAKSYLPRRLSYLAEQHGFSYQRVRFSHASTRWGSCSSTGTISLNIALMKLRFELIDYLLLHELVHTEHMNHSKSFWQRLETVAPDYIALRKEIKRESPSI